MELLLCNKCHKVLDKTYWQVQSKRPLDVRYNNSIHLCDDCYSSIIKDIILSPKEMLPFIKEGDINE